MCGILAACRDSRTNWSELLECGSQHGKPLRETARRSRRAHAMRVFLDAIILSSAAKSNGAVRELLRLLRDSELECWLPQCVCAAMRWSRATARTPVQVTASYSVA